MNDFKNIASDNPVVDQWKMLMRFSYPTNIINYLTTHGFSQQETTLVEFIAGCFRQSEAYFIVSGNAPLDISPLLLYYGATNLLAGTTAILTNAKPNIKNHGIQPVLSGMNLTNIASFQIRPFDAITGALQQFARTFSDNCNIANSGNWTLEELLGSIPDLKRDFEICYPTAPYFTIPVQIVHRHEGTLERILKNELTRYPNSQDALSKILDIGKAYIAPQDTKDYFILHPKIGAKPIGAYSIFGQKYLNIAHSKNGKAISPTQLIIMLMGLFTLGYMSRYQPEVWNPFVKADNTGERLVVEKFMQICQRYFPNLVLNVIQGERIQFSHELVGTLDVISKPADSG